jgi:hypothetical protein
MEDNFIYIKKDALDKSVCKRFIELFEESDLKSRASNRSSKKSTDIYFDPRILHDNTKWGVWGEVLPPLMYALRDGMKDYAKKYDVIEYLRPFKINFFNIQKYEPGEGIAAHRDHTGYFTGDIATLSLGSAYVMRFRPHSENKLVDPSIFYDFLLPVGSLAVMKDDASTKWTHEIRKVKYDTIDDKKIKRGTRISITFRTVRDELQED